MEQTLEAPITSTTLKKWGTQSIIGVVVLSITTALISSTAFFYNTPKDIQSLQTTTVKLEQQIKEVTNATQALPVNKVKMDNFESILNSVQDNQKRFDEKLDKIYLLIYEDIQRKK
ncbi:MAG: hypothetical protein AABY22_16125 [Nanoarchaeota archaeon]